MTTATQNDVQYKVLIGMEIHVQLATKSKMFTSAANGAHPDHFNAAPNTMVDPVVLGLPGVLPVINKRAVEMSMMVGLALNWHDCRVHEVGSEELLLSGFAEELSDFAV